MNWSVVWGSAVRVRVSESNAVIEAGSIGSLNWIVARLSVFSPVLGEFGKPSGVGEIEMKQASNPTSSAGT